LDIRICRTQVLVLEKPWLNVSGSCHVLVS
jgi:hypothetical protein